MQKWASFDLNSVAIVVHQVKELKLVDLVLFTKFLGNLYFVGRVMQIFVQKSPNTTVL
jgi:hypothetical protein